MKHDAKPDAPDASPCKHTSGVLVPHINRNRCEGKGACVDVCPHGVLAARKFERNELADLTLLGTIKAWVHGAIQAEVLRPDHCHGCGLCVQACPEQAIVLLRFPQPFE